jgi:hypothetical protein
MGIEYMVTGSTAAMIYGEPRLTHDIDLVVDLKPKHISAFHAFFSNDKFYVPPVEVLHVESARNIGGHFNLIHHKTGFKADIYLKGVDKLHAWAFKRRNMETIQDDKIWLAPPEYVIVRKLMYYKEGGSEKHLNDIQNIFANADTKIDHESIREQVKKQDLTDIWKEFE